ncbi:MAG: putative metal-binding motif-containing protein [Bacteroidetes bacterium]|nr:putative metal-binding motif-containing protein [Bacteroidota bacterium]
MYGVDDNCMVLIDDGVVSQMYYVDGDGDGFGAGVGTLSCSPIAGSVTNNTDCNDANAAINPNATEVCNGIDDNCDGNTDEGLTFFNLAMLTVDGDGYGRVQELFLCSIVGSVLVDGDCNDAAPAINPGATEFVT